MKQLAILDKCNENSNFWMINISPDYIQRVIDKQIFGARTKRSVNINKFRRKDILLLCTKFDNQYVIIGVSMVDAIMVNDKKLFNHFLSDKKVTIKSVKYFENPIIINSIKEEVNVKNFTKKEFLQITKEESIFILQKEKLLNTKPLNLSKIEFNLDEFLLNSIKSTYHIITKDKSEKQMDIHDFINLWNEVLEILGVKKNIDELEKYYSHNIWKLNFKHVPSRDPDKNILLYDGNGKSKNFGYIILKN